MKKTIAAILGTLLFTGVMTPAMAMDSETLLSNPERYRVVYADEEQMVYADKESLRSMATRDYPGSIENLSAVMYVETYKPRRDAMDFENDSLVRRIDEYTVQLYGNKAKGIYSMEKAFAASYDSTGRKLTDAGNARWDAEAGELYLTLFRMARL